MIRTGLHKTVAVNLCKQADAWLDGHCDMQSSRIIKDYIIMLFRSRVSFTSVTADAHLLETQYRQDRVQLCCPNTSVLDN